MYKISFIILLLISPVYFLFVGYPITSSKTITYQTALVTNRCFQIGNLQEFLLCFKTHQRISGEKLIESLTTDINDMQSNMGTVFIIFCITQICLIPFVLKKLT